MTTLTQASPVLDPVPEYYHYEDTGCEVSPACLDCPLPQCKYDDPDWFHRYQRLMRDLEVWSAVHSGELTVQEAAARFSLTARTVFRIVRRCREAVEQGALGMLEAGALSPWADPALARR